MATEDCAICGESVPFATTTHVLVNPKHEDGVADHYVCRPCYDDHLADLFVALSAETSGGDDGSEPSRETGAAADSASTDEQPSATDDRPDSSGTAPDTTSVE